MGVSLKSLMRQESNFFNRGLKAGVIALLLVMSGLIGVVLFGCGESKRETEELAQKEREAKVKTNQGARAGELKVFIIAPGVEVKFRWCPATGAKGFMMGSPTTEKDRGSDETQHKVVLTKGFWMGETEVTQGQWEAVMGTTLRQLRDKVDKSWPLRGEGGVYPMYYVSWDDVQDFIKKVNQSGKLPKGMKAVLPTEAQWEYACRAGSTGAAYAGTGNLDDMGWYLDNAEKTTHPVGHKKANAWVLKDMHGNVWEWCSDWDGAYPRGLVIDPTGASGGSYRVFRGGCWYGAAKFCRSAIRARYLPGLGDYVLGFRLSLQPVSK